MAFDYDENFFNVEFKKYLDSDTIRVPDKFRTKDFIKHLLCNYLEINIIHLSSKQRTELYKRVPVRIVRFKQNKKQDQKVVKLRKWLSLYCQSEVKNIEKEPVVTVRIEDPGWQVVDEVGGEDAPSGNNETTHAGSSKETPSTSKETPSTSKADKQNVPVETIEIPDSDDENLPAIPGLDTTEKRKKDESKTGKPCDWSSFRIPKKSSVPTPIVDKDKNAEPKNGTAVEPVVPKISLVVSLKDMPEKLMDRPETTPKKIQERRRTNVELELVPKPVDNRKNDKTNMATHSNSGNNPGTSRENPQKDRPNKITNRRETIGDFINPSIQNRDPRLKKLEMQAVQKTVEKSDKNLTIQGHSAPNAREIQPKIDSFIISKPKKIQSRRETIGEFQLPKKITERRSTNIEIQLVDDQVEDTTVDIPVAPNEEEEEEEIHVDSCGPSCKSCKPIKPLKTPMTVSFIEQPLEKPKKIMKRRETVAGEPKNAKKIKQRRSTNVDSAPPKKPINNKKSNKNQAVVQQESASTSTTNQITEVSSKPKKIQRRRETIAVSNQQESASTSVTNQIMEVSSKPKKIQRRRETIGISNQPAKIVNKRRQTIVEQEPTKNNKEAENNVIPAKIMNRRRLTVDVFRPNVTVPQNDENSPPFDDQVMSCDIKKLVDTNYRKRNNKVGINGMTANVCNYYFELNPELKMLSLAKGSPMETTYHDSFTLKELLFLPGVGVKIELPEITIQRYCTSEVEAELFEQSESMKLGEEHLQCNRRDVFSYNASRKEKNISDLANEVFLCHDYILSYLKLMLKCLKVSNYEKKHEIEYILQLLYEDLNKLTKSALKVSYSYFLFDHKYFREFIHDVEMSSATKLYNLREYCNPEIVFSVTRCPFQELQNTDYKKVLDNFKAILVEKDPDAIEAFDKKLQDGYTLFCVSCLKNGSPYSYNGPPKGQYKGKENVSKISEHIRQLSLNEFYCVDCGDHADIRKLVRDKWYHRCD